MTSFRTFLAVGALIGAGLFAGACGNVVRIVGQSGSGGGQSVGSVNSTSAGQPTSAGGMTTGSGQTCAAAAAAAPGQCSVASAPDGDLTLLGTKAALVGHWYGCGQAVPLGMKDITVAGIVFFPDGTFQLLRQDLCPSNHAADGTWELPDNPPLDGTGEYTLHLSWPGFAEEFVGVSFANKRAHVRFTTSGVDLVRF